jgi:hypothetical protein
MLTDLLKQLFPARAPLVTPAAPTSSAAAGLYLDLLKRCLTDSVYDDGLDLIRGNFVVDPLPARSGRRRSYADAGSETLGPHLAQSCPYHGRDGSPG